MFKPTAARSAAEYLAALPSERRAVLEQLDALIRATAPSLTPHFASNMLGYGSFPYRNAKKELVSWPVVAVASQKNYISIYVCAIHDGGYLAETHKAELGQVSVGKSCIRFKKLSDINLTGLQKVLRLAEQHPGFGREV